jgi:hypothetical protein
LTNNHDGQRGKLRITYSETGAKLLLAEIEGNAEDTAA